MFKVINKGINNSRRIIYKFLKNKIKRKQKKKF